MADFYNITTWNEKPWYQTGGTRSKVIVENPENDAEYYFKTSLKREKKGNYLGTVLYGDILIGC